MILVTGGTGLLGSHLLYELVSSGKKVKAIKRPTSNLRKVKNVFSYYSKDYERLFNSIIWVDGDILDYYSIIEALQDVDYIYHAAALVSFDSRDKKQLFKINTEGTANIVNCALKTLLPNSDKVSSTHQGIKKLCYVSSIAALGRPIDNIENDEQTQWEDSPNNSDYAISKYFGEQEVWRASAEGLNVIIVNPSVIIGPGFWESVSGKMITTVWNGLKFYSTGINGFVDVRDVSRAMIKLMESEIKNERFIISSENISYQTFFEIVADCLGKKRPSIKVTPFIGAIGWRLAKIYGWLQGQPPLITKATAQLALHRYFYSNKKIRQVLNYNFIPVRKAIEDTCKIFLKEQ